MEEKSKAKNILEWIYCSIIAIVIVLLIKTFVFVPTSVQQTSMDPTLKPNDRLYLSRIATTFNKVPKRGDIVTFEAPTQRDVDINHYDPENPVAEYNYTPNGVIGKFAYYVLEWGKTSYIKRVIGLPGEHVQIKNGSVYINGEKLEEDYLQDYVVTDVSRGGVFTDVIVPENTVYLLGDNRGDSVDSRKFGCVPIEKLESHAIFRFWPLNKFGGI